MPRHNSKAITRQIWDFKAADFDGLNVALVSLPWYDILPNTVDVDIMASNFTNTLHSIAEMFIPVKVITRHARDKPWMNNMIKKLIRKRNRAFKRYKKTGRHDHLEIYRSLRNRTLRECRKQKVIYDDKLNDKLSASAQSDDFWKLVKPFFSDTSSNSIPPLITDNGIVNDSVSKATLFNDYFCFSV